MHRVALLTGNNLINSEVSYMPGQGRCGRISKGQCMRISPNMATLQGFSGRCMRVRSCKGVLYSSVLGLHAASLKSPGASGVGEESALKVAMFRGHFVRLFACAFSPEIHAVMPLPAFRPQTVFSPPPPSHSACQVLPRTLISTAK